MPATFQLKIKTENPIVLNNLESFYLRLYVHGQSSSEIANFLEIDPKLIYKIRSAIAKKYATDNWDVIVCRAFKNGTLKQTDYTNTKVKDYALHYTQIIYTQFNLAVNTKELKVKLKALLLEFYYEVDIALVAQYEDRSEKYKLNAIEMAILIEKFNGASKQAIIQSLNLQDNTYIKYKQNIYRKLGVNNWINAYIRGFEANLFELDKAHDTNMENELQSANFKIAQLRQLKRLKTNEKKLSIYTQLLKCYSAIKFYALIYKN